MRKFFVLRLCYSTSASNRSEKESHIEVVSIMMTDVIADMTMTEMKRKLISSRKLLRSESTKSHPSGIKCKP